MDNLIYALLFIPLLVPAVSLFRVLSGRALWWFASVVAGADFLGFAILFSRFYANSKWLSDGIRTREIPWSSAWEIGFQFHLDYLSASLLLALAFIFFLSILNARQSFEQSRAKLAALCIYQAFLLGIVAAQDFSLSVVFLSGLLVPELLLMGWDEATDRAATLKKHALSASISSGILMICVLFFSASFRASVSHWFSLSNGDYELPYRNLAFLLFCLAIALRMPIFPFQSRLGCIYRLQSIEHLLPQLCSANIGFYILFRYGPNFFHQELIAFSEVLAWLATAHIFYSILYVARNAGHREHIYGTQQIWNGLLLLGFVGFGSAGWVGAWSLYLMQLLVLALALFVAIAVERRGKILSSETLIVAPAYSAASVFATVALLGTPITAAFYSIALILWSGMEIHRAATLPIILSLPLYLWIGVRRLFFRYSGTETISSGNSKVLELDRTEAAVLFSIGLVILVCGIWPDLLMKPIGIEVSQYLQAGGNK